MAHLLVSGEEGKSFHVELFDDTLIGRSKDADLVLPYSTVSRQHTRIRRTKDGYRVQDLDSYNGTLVNGKPIRDHLLKDRDVIGVGSCRLTFLEQTIRGEFGHLSVKPDTPIRRFPQEQTNIAIAEDTNQLLTTFERPGLNEDFPFWQGGATADAPPAGSEEYEKAGRALFILYQISRHLNRNTNFEELLSVIMDLIFDMMGADHGIVALVGDTPDEIVPKVVKTREDGNVTAPITVSRTIFNKVVKDKVSILAANALSDGPFCGAASIVVQNIQSVLSVPLWSKNDVIGMIQVDSCRSTSLFNRTDLDILTTISSQMALIIEQANLNAAIRREEEARRRLERFHSPEVVEMILSVVEGDEEHLMAPTEKNATMLFADIVNFTALAERLPPVQIIRLLNRCFEELTDIVFEYQGTLDKYMGDALMAVFGAPIEREDDAERAVRAALRMRQTLDRLMKTLPPDRRFDVRIGLNTGRVVAGNVGSPIRMEYTVIGDAVNTAARLESAAQPNQILISEETWRAVRHVVDAEFAGARTLKGKAEPINTYAVRGLWEETEG